MKSLDSKMDEFKKGKDECERWNARMNEVQVILLRLAQKHNGCKD